MAGIGRIIGGIIVLIILGLPLLAVGLLAIVLGTAFLGGLGFTFGLIIAIPGILFFLLGIWLIISGIKARERAKAPQMMPPTQAMPPAPPR